MTIVEFLEARLAEDEAFAHISGEARIAWLTFRDNRGAMRYTITASEAADGTWVADGAAVLDYADVVIVYDPARALREVAAKRAILAQRAAWEFYPSQAQMVLDGVLRNLASVYADHSNYDQTWAS